MAEVVEGDGAVGEEEVSGREARERRAAEVHDHLHERRELRVGLHPPSQLPREQLQEAPQLLLLGPIRPREALRLGLAPRGAEGARAPTAALGEEAHRRRAGRDGWCAGSMAARWRDRVGRDEGETEAEVERRRGRGRHRRGPRPERTSGGKAFAMGSGCFGLLHPCSLIATAGLGDWTDQITPRQTVECQLPCYYCSTRFGKGVIGRQSKKKRKRKKE